MKKKMALILSLLVMLALACNLSSIPTSQAPGNTPQGNGSQSQPGGTPPANPVGTEPNAPDVGVDRRV